METNQTAPEPGTAPDDAKGDSASQAGPGDGAVGSAPVADAAGAGTGFFGWLRGLGVPRRQGWLGGVCAGVAARIGIDPIIVRGIVVVVAVLGAPFVLVYAIAWLLLPDVDGRIHLERLVAGIVDPAVVGIAVMGVIGLIPLVQGGWLGWRWWPEWPSFWLGGLDVLAPLRVLWVLAVIAAVIVLVVWLVRRSAQTSPGGGSGPDSRTASASTATAPGSPTAMTPTADATTTAAPVSAFASPPHRPPSHPCPPSAPTPTRSPNGGHSTRRGAVSHAEWRRSTVDAERAARARAAQENKIAAQALAAESEAARRIRRAERPRTSAAYVFTVLGIALVAGSIAAIWALGEPAASGDVFAIAVAVAVIALAIGMLVAALRRRRAGFLAFVTALVTVIMLVAALAPQSAIVPPSSSIPLDRSGSYLQPIGNAFFTATADLDAVRGTPDVELTQWVGDVYVDVHDGVRVALDARGARDVSVVRVDASGDPVPTRAGDGDGLLVVGGEAGDPVDADLTVRRGGNVFVTVFEGASR